MGEGEREERGGGKASAEGAYSQTEFRIPREKGTVFHVKR